MHTAVTATGHVDFYFFIFKGFIYLFLERGMEGQRKGEKYGCKKDTTERDTTLISYLFFLFF